LYSNDWAAASAVRDYAIDAGRVKVVPFGANVEGFGSGEDGRAIIAGRRLDPIRLLFIGKDWERKRGNLAVAIATGLNQRGVRTHLHIVGSDAPPSPFVTGHGFVSNATPEGQRQL